MRNDILISPEIDVRSALKLLDSTGLGVLLVIDQNKTLLGTLTDGDVRRFILSGREINETIDGAYNRSPRFLYQDEDYLDKAKRLFLEERIELIPIVDSQKRIEKYLTWDEVLSENEKKNQPVEILDIPVVIMAGGKGVRMAPFTNVLPKPLIPVGEKTILEYIIDEFRRYGIKEYFLTLNYKGEMIRAYMNGIERDYNVDYVNETDFWGTAGSLTLLADAISDTFIVSNCDIIVKANYSEVIQFHKLNSAALTILSSIQHHKIPYGVINFTTGGIVTEIKEKPEYTFPINTGVYVLERKCLNYIPEGEVFNMTDLISILLEKGELVYTYPVNEREYIDVGQWEEYRQAVTLLK